MATVRLQQLALTLVFDYVPIGIAIGGIVLSIRAFFKKNNPGFLVVALVFTKPILNHVFWWMNERKFVDVQLDANTWTAPVRHVDGLEPVFFAMLLFAVWLIRRKYPAARGGTQNQKDQGATTTRALGEDC
jgi:hypothetical protein